jgi:hypothetical protein
LFQVPIQARAPDTQHLSGANAVSAASIEHSLDVLIAQLFERHRTPGPGPSLRQWAAQMLRQIVQVDEIICGE